MSKKHKVRKIKRYSGDPPFILLLPIKSINNHPFTQLFYEVGDGSLYKNAKVIRWHCGYLCLLADDNYRLIICEKDWNKCSMDYLNAVDFEICVKES
jgi:hypothetical protein